MRRQSDFNEPIYLDSLQIELIGYTKIRAMDAHRTESSSWVITSRSGMGVLLDIVHSTIGSEVSVSNEYWTRRPLPNTVVPSFDTCNISRYYELEVRVGLSCGAPRSSKVSPHLPRSSVTLAAIHSFHSWLAVFVQSNANMISALFIRSPPSPSKGPSVLRYYATPGAVGCRSCRATTLQRSVCSTG